MQRAGYWLFTLTLFACGLITSSSAAANETICVTSSGGVGNTVLLLSAMDIFGGASDETIFIHLEQGVYTINSEQNLIPAGNASLHLVGGFVPGTACTQRAVDPTLTTIKGSGLNFLVFGQKNGELLVDGLTFSFWGNGVEFRVFGDVSATLRNIVAEGNGAVDYIGALTLSHYGGTGKLRVENCLIYDNSAQAGLNLVSDSDNTTAIVDNCTIVNNSHNGLYFGDVVDAFMGAAFGYSNIIRDNPDGDVDTSFAAVKPTFAYSDIGSISGAVTTSNNINLDPKFAGVVNPPLARFELLDNSPAINKGAAASTIIAQTGDSTFAYADTDIRGRKRRIGSRVDMGAYESKVDDTAAQPVYSTADTTTGNTLREAITNANSNANPTTIVFNISGGCPQLITLSQPLPNITSDVTIDGYSQSGSAVNTQVPGYDGTICVILRGIGIDHALQTSGSGRLTVRGIEFEGFSTAAIHLASGSGHIVTGNAFAAFAGSSGNKDGVLIDGTATYSQIGSYAFGDRNVFDQASDAAIKLSSNGTGHHVIQGNYMGFGADGTVWSGTQNKYGIYVADSGSNEISYNYIGGQQLNAMHLTGAATTANRIIENSIGSAPADGAADGGGYGTCNPFCLGGYGAIDILAGAHDNFVGAIGGNGGNNFITNNAGPGVLVESTGGNGNRVYGNNVIHDNYGYLPIDLGNLGPLLNDVGDGDTGGNKLQNYPTLSQALRIEADVVRLSGSLVAQTGVAAGGYRIDVFWTDTCLYSGGGTDTPRGDMKRYVGFFNIYSDGSSPNVPYSAIDALANTNIPKPTQASPGYLFAVATDANGNSSEPGPCRAFVDDYIFSNAFN